MKNKKPTTFIQEQILTYSIDELVSNRFARYARYVLIDRAIPNVYDGLKPVQRRILYAMADLGLYAEKPYKKSARVVGEVIGKYHPHGDLSVYNAMIRMAQPWKYNMPLVDMQGNKGSIDGDSAAAMRYTETRLSAISQLMLADLKKNVVNFGPNFDETEHEPVLLPAYFPNLLVNGASGIAVGLATNIPPHNLSEVLNSVIYKIKNPEATLSEIMRAGIKGPDFPTGGIIQGTSGIKTAYKTGKGRIIIRAKVNHEQKATKHGDQSLVITEIPYEVVKQDLVKKIEEARLAKNAIAGIKEVRDETDRTGLRIVIDLTAEANYQQVLNYLLKTTSLQISYNLNLVAIADKKPKLLNLVTIIQHYIDHQQNVLTRKSKFELTQYQERLEIIAGLIIALSAIDEVVSIIRKSQDKANAKLKLVNRFSLSPVQAEAIVQLRLYRLSAADIAELKQEKTELENKIAYLKAILSDKNKLNEAIINNLTETKKQYQIPRQSQLDGEISEIIIDEKAAITATNLFINISYDGWIKAVNEKIVQQHPDYSEFGRKPNDLIVAQGIISNLDNLFLISNKGNYFVIPAHKLIENKWKEIGVHFNTFCKLEANEKIIASAVYNKKIAHAQSLLLLSEQGMVKQIAIADLILDRIAKKVKCMSLSSQDSLIFSSFVNQKDWITLTTNQGFTLKYLISQISVLGLNAKGIKAVKLTNGDYVVGAAVASSNDIYALLTNNGLIKRLSVSSISQTTRATKGNKIIKFSKKNEQTIVSTFLANNNVNFNLLTNNEKWRFFSNQEQVSVSRSNEINNKAIAESISKAQAIHLWNLK